MLGYEIVDVFTDRPFAGNPLAVVLGGADLTAPQMQALAREFHLSETAFPVPSEDPAGPPGYRVRIFTPERELPFAGHPSVGTAWLLAQRGLLPAGDVVQECAAGTYRLTIHGTDGPVELHAGPATYDEPLPPGPLLAAVGLREADRAPGIPPRSAGAGLDWTYLTVRPAAVARAGPLSVAPQTVRELAPNGVYVHAVTDAGPGRVAVHARAFTDDMGIPEDPATGSAALGLAGHLVASGLAPPDGAFTYVVAQGGELGRPSTITGRLLAAAGQVRSCSVAGGVVPVAAGRIARPAT